MDFPECSFPVRHCLHDGLRGRRRLEFADYGSHTQVNACPLEDETSSSIRFKPQKGLGWIKGLLNNLPSLPVFDQPILENYVLHDRILGVDHFEDTIQSLGTYLNLIQSAKREMCKGKESFCLLLGECEAAVNDCIEDPNNTDLLSRLQDKLPTWLINSLKNYSTASAVLNDDCLMGFNRNFYQGLLCHNHSSPSTTLFHASGNEFKDIYMSEVSQDESVLPCGRQISKVTLKNPVFQLKCSKKGLLCARQKKKCVLLKYDHSGLDVSLTAALEDKVRLSDVSFSPYFPEEILLSAKRGAVALWNINSGCHTLLHKEPKSDCKDSWTSIHFAGHPRQVVVADCSTVELFDHRDHFSKGLELFHLSSSLVKSHESVMASDSLGFPYHLVATDYTYFVMDQRFLGSPVLQWSSESMTAPQLLQSHQLSHFGEGERWIFAGTQQPAEVTCYPLNLTKGCAPVTKTLPWRAGKLGEFCRKQHTSYVPHYFEMDKHFQSSLAGMTVVDHSAQGQQILSVYQMDGYGDIFYQDFKLSPHLVDAGCYSLAPTLPDEASAVDQRATRFLSALDAKQNPKSNLSLPDPGAEEPLSYSMITPVLKGECEPNPALRHKKKIKEYKGLTFAEFQRKVCSKSEFKEMKHLHQTACNTRLLVSLKDNKDIKEVLVEREADYLGKRIALTMKYKEEKEHIPSMPKKKKKLIKKKLTQEEEDRMIDHVVKSFERETIDNVFGEERDMIDNVFGDEMEMVDNVLGGEDGSDG